uniref:Negative elongation factor D n=1 Tax=Romanomermis culicivorax TaxID=13658 RepID=A0A915KSJ9_ROMCU
MNGSEDQSSLNSSFSNERRNSEASNLTDELNNPDWSENLTDDDFGIDTSPKHVLDISEKDIDEEEHLEEIKPEEVQAECSKYFSTPDFILEPAVFNTLSRYFQAQGDPVKVINSLCDNYMALSQVCNVMAEWLSILGCDSNDVNAIFENHLQTLIMKYFDPAKADTIFNQNQQAEGQIEWLPDVISFAPWRRMIYRLSDRYPECLMLNFAIKLISDAGYQSEISGVTTATQQLDIFSRVLCAAVENSLSLNVDTVKYKQSISELAKVVGHGEHTYLYAQSLLHCLACDPKHGPAATRISQELREIFRRIAGPETTDVALVLHNSQPNFNNSSHHRTCNPSVLQAMHSMLSRHSLNPADISLLYNYYNGSDPPAVEIIRDTIFLDMLVDALFKPKAKLHQDHKSNFIIPNQVQIRKLVSNKDEIKNVQQSIEKAQDILSECGPSGNLTLVDLQTIFQSLRYPVVGAGVLHWVRHILTDDDYFKSHPEPLPANLTLVDEIATLHPLLHDRLFSLLIQLFEIEHDGVDVLVQLERRKTLIDRLVHLLSCGHALPVANYIRQRLLRNDADVSLIRYFVTETLEIIAPPYSPEFAELFLPLVENVDICRRETMNDEKWEAVKLFLDQ